MCVTGASGYIASDLIANLLSRGLFVHGTVRSTSPGKCSHLLELPGARERLQLFEADLKGPSAGFVEAIKGCSIVFHTACPFVYNARAACLGEDFFVGPAVQGTETVLAACREAGGIKRVVMTSSCAAIFKKNVPEGHVYSEVDWNDPEELATRKMWYSIGKTKQEQAAWAWMENEKPEFSLVCINPVRKLWPYPSQPPIFHHKTYPHKPAPNHHAAFFLLSSAWWRVQPDSPTSMPARKTCLICAVEPSPSFPT